MNNIYTRKAGILLHPASLHGDYSIGTLGDKCLEFIDFLEKSKQKLWQIFPLGPTGYGDSPYQSFSAFAGNPYLIDLEYLVKDGLLTYDDINCLKDENYGNIDYGKLYNLKNSILEKSYLNKQIYQKEFDDFKEKNKDWLDDYSLFISLKSYYNGKPWSSWDADIKFRKKDSLEKIEKKLEKEIDINKFIQFIFFKQWKNVKKYANSKGIEIIGDIPIFVSMDSADAWANKDLFMFDINLNPSKVAGVPPDYFSKTGQLWGNPLYDWSYHKKTDYKWWKNRIKLNLELFDIIRIDHFRGFESYWAIDADQTTAINGKWETGPGIEFFDKINEAFSSIEIIAEDLGILTDEVVALKNEAGLPGMKILQFAFDGDSSNNYLPHNYETNSVVYTGTHDNDTTLSWYESLDDVSRKQIKDYINNYDDKAVCWGLIKLALMSTSKYAIIPLQDYLALGSEARINTPGLASGNWQFRIKPNALSDELAGSIAFFVDLYGR